MTQDHEMGFSFVDVKSSQLDSVFWRDCIVPCCPSPGQTKMIYLFTCCLLFIKFFQIFAVNPSCIPYSKALFYFLHVWMLFRKIRTMWIIWSSQAHTTFALTTGSPNISVCQGELIKNVEQKQGTKIKKKKGSTLRELHFDFIQYVKSRFWHLNFLNMSETSRWIPSTVLVKRTAVTLEVSMLTKSTTSFQRFSHAYAIILQRSHHCPIRNGKIQKK